MADTPDNPEDENVSPLPTAGVQITTSKNRIVLSRRKAALLIGLILIIVLGSIALLTFRALNRRTAPAHPNVPDNSNSAMFGFDLQHIHFNPTENILNTANVSRLVSYWTVPTKSYVISSPAVANGMIYFGSYDPSSMHVMPGQEGFCGPTILQIRSVLHRRSLMESCMSAPGTGSCMPSICQLERLDLASYVRYEVQMTFVRAGQSFDGGGLAIKDSKIVYSNAKVWVST